MRVQNLQQVFSALGEGFGRCRREHQERVEVGCFLKCLDDVIEAVVFRFVSVGNQYRQRAETHTQPADVFPILGLGRRRFAARRGVAGDEDDFGLFFQQRLRQRQ